MSQLPLQESTPGVPAGSTESPEMRIAPGSHKVENVSGAALPHYDQPHSRVRGKLMRVNALLYKDVEGSLLGVDLRELEKAVSAFLSVVHILGRGQRHALASTEGTFFRPVRSSGRRSSRGKNDKKGKPGG